MSAKVSIVVPVYNEAGSVAQVLERLRELPLDKEIIVVDDGSTDGTAAAIESVAARAPEIQCFRQPVNVGKGAALRLGFSRASGDVVAVQDADLELDPRQLPTLVAAVMDGRADVVYGSRFLAGKPGGSWTYYLGNRGLAALTNLLYGSRLTDMETCYKVLRREVLASLTLRANRFDIEPEITAEVLSRGHRILELPVSYTARGAHEGKKLKWSDGLAAAWTLVQHRLR